MKNKIFYNVIFALSACSSLTVPDNFRYQEVQTTTFKIATWQKITDKNAPFKIYIEGDGYAFTPSGQISRNPTPRSTLMREIAFGDTHKNVLYLARPCQYVKEDSYCKPIYWSTARFSDEVINAEFEVLQKTAGKNNLTIVGFSGGAQIAGLIAVKYGNNLKIDKLITIAGNLDVKSWTDYHNLPSLNLSDDLSNYKETYKKFPQIHYVGSNDNNIIPSITENFVENKQTIIKVEKASHNNGWQNIYKEIQTQ